MWCTIFHGFLRHSILVMVACCLCGSVDLSVRGELVTRLRSCREESAKIAMARIVTTLGSARRDGLTASNSSNRPALLRHRDIPITIRHSCPSSSRGSFREPPLPAFTEVQCPRFQPARGRTQGARVAGALREHLSHLRRQDCRRKLERVRTTHAGYRRG